MSRCNMDCFRCPFDDCINDVVTYADMKQSNALDRMATSKPKRKRDPVKTREQNKRWRQNNPDKVREIRRRYEKNHREERKQYMKELNARARFELIRDQWKL